ncbi:hypothetical protein Q8A67_015886 [Cirrhinus molitorella]|uniref:Ig-like domain-containing protein n=1 Tax=Cirrhinus molitorella TaxID=172907 RepID=A0AA88THS1_9TELE|nr:hypothetical protein Q8A67_015886 [Cirrhinus molitorella]
MWTVIPLLLEVTLTCASTHSLTYFFTAVSGDINIPEFTIVGLVDEEQFIYFDSNMKKVVPKTEWMKQKEEADYWDTQTQLADGTHHAFRNNIQVAKDRLEQQMGFVRKVMMERTLSLDLQEMRWISPVQQGFSTQNKWNNNRAYLEARKHYFSTVCIEWLKKYVEYRKSRLEKTVSPQVSLLQKDPSSPVTCHATGFYPSGVTITWMRNGQEHYTDVDLGELLPNADGTFQRTSTITVTPDEWKKNQFSCEVKHQSKTIRKILSEKEIRTNRGDSVPIGIIAFAVILLIIIGVAGYMVYLKKRGEDGQL